MKPTLEQILNSGGLGCVIFQQMQVYQDNVAQVDGVTGKTENYKSLLQRCVRTALAMRARGITAEDIVNVCGIPTLDICVPFLATLFLGAKPTTLDPHFSLMEITLLLKQVKPKIVFAGEEVVEKMEQAVKEIGDIEIVVLGNHPNHTSFEEFLKPIPEEETFKPVPAKDLKDTALILFSSGTSGLPKGICLHHYGFLMMSQRMNFQISSMLTFSSLNWISTIGTMFGCVCNGLRRVIVPGFNADTFWELLNNYQPEFVFLVPSQVARLIKRPRIPAAQPFLRAAMIGGGPILEHQMKAFRAMIPEAVVLFSYAQTELFGPTTMFNPLDPKQESLYEEKLTSCGVALPNVEFKIVDLQTEQDLGPNQKGELRIKSNTVMKGYYNMDSSDVWDKDGWLKTGDIAYYDDDRCLYVIDRVKEMFVYRGYHVVPAFVEEILQQHPAVEDAVVIGIPHEEDGDHAMALVVVSKNNNEVTPKEIEQFVEERVGDAQRLRAGVKFIDLIPRTSTGKIRRREIKEKILNKEM